MQVRITDDGHLVIPVPICLQLGIGPGTWLEVAVDHDKLQAFVVAPKQSIQANVRRQSRLANLKPHPEALNGSDDYLDQFKVWDEVAWLDTGTLFYSPMA